MKNKQSFWYHCRCCRDCTTCCGKCCVILNRFESLMKKILNICLLNLKNIFKYTPIDSITIELIHWIVVFCWTLCWGELMLSRKGHHIPRPVVGNTYNYDNNEILNILIMIMMPNSESKKYLTCTLIWRNSINLELKIMSRKIVNMLL